MSNSRLIIKEIIKKQKIISLKRKTNLFAKKQQQEKIPMWQKSKEERLKKNSWIS